MANIKVTYGQVSRRFKISPTTTWSAFESQLRSLFKIPISTLITISYTDEDGDVITLSSDLELFEVLSSAREYGDDNNDTLLKLVLTVSSDENAEDSNSWMFEGGTVHTKERGNVNLDNDASECDSINDFSEGNPLIELNEDKQVPPTHNHVTLSEEEPTFKPTISSVDTSQNKESHKRKSDISQHETVGENSTFFSSHPSSFSSSSNIKRSENQSPNEVHDQEERSPEERNGLDGLEGDFIILTQLPFFGPILSSFAHPPFPRHSRSHRCRHSSFYNRTYYHRGQCAVGSIFKGIMKFILLISLFFTFVKLFFIAFCPLVTIFLLWKGLTFINRFHRGPEYYNERRQCYHEHCCHEGYGRECERSRDESCNEFNYSRGSTLNQQCGACFRSPNGRNISETDIKEKLETLKSMGFSVNDKKLEELVRRYSGNMKKVIDRLLES